LSFGSDFLAGAPSHRSRNLSAERCTRFLYDIPLDFGYITI